MTTQYDGFHPDSYSSLTNARGHHPAADPGQETQPRSHQRDHDSNHVQAVIDRNNRLRQGPVIAHHQLVPTARHEKYDNDQRHLPPHQDRTNPHRAEPVVADHEVGTTAHQDEHRGVKIGSTLFGWLTATTIVGLLTALLAALMW